MSDLTHGTCKRKRRCPMCHSHRAVSAATAQPQPSHSAVPRVTLTAQSQHSHSTVPCVTLTAQSQQSQHSHSAVTTQSQRSHSTVTALSHMSLSQCSHSAVTRSRQWRGPANSLVRCWGACTWLRYFFRKT